MTSKTPNAAARLIQGTRKATNEEVEAFAKGEMQAAPISAAPAPVPPAPPPYVAPAPISPAPRAYAPAAAMPEPVERPIGPGSARLQREAARGLFRTTIVMTSVEADCIRQARADVMLREKLEVDNSEVIRVAIAALMELPAEQRLERIAALARQKAGRRRLS